MNPDQFANTGQTGTESLDKGANLSDSEQPLESAIEPEPSQEITLDLVARTAFELCKFNPKALGLAEASGDRTTYLHELGLEAIRLLFVWAASERKENRTCLKACKNVERPPRSATG